MTAYRLQAAHGVVSRRVVGHFNVLVVKLVRLIYIAALEEVVVAQGVLEQW